MPNKVSRLNACTHLEIFDLPALRILMSHHQIMDLASPLFPSVTLLSLGPHLVQHLGLSNDQHLHHLVRRFEQVFSPTRLCVTYPSYDCSIEFLRRRYTKRAQTTTTQSWWQNGKKLGTACGNIVSIMVYHIKSAISPTTGGPELSYSTIWEPKYYPKPLAQK